MYSARRGRLLSVAIIVAFSITAVGCASSTAVGQPSPALNLSELFSANTIASGKRTEGGGSFTRHFEVLRNGLTQDAMVLEAPVTIRAALKGITRGAILEGLSTPVFNVGDGMQMDIALIEEGRRRVVFSRYYDAGRRIEDRAWIPLRIPLDLNTSPGNAELEIRVSGGPQGDLVADWLALSAMRIVQGQRQQ